MWVARNQCGSLWLFERKPHRQYFKFAEEEHKDSLGYWEAEITYDNGKGYEDNSMQLEQDQFKDLKWEDEPIEIELVPKMLNAVQEKLAKSVDDYFEYVGHVQDIHPYSKEQEQNYYNDMCWRWQDWDAIKHYPSSTWDLNFEDYVGSKK